MRSIPAGWLYSHLANEQDTTGPGQSPAQDVFSGSRIARYTGLGSTPPAFRRISQETLRRWERSAREASVICNQTASFNRCLVRVQQNMKEQLKVLKAENKGKGSAKVSPAVDELHYLLDFNASISQAAAKSMEHLSDFVFITMGNLTLVRRDAYLSHLRTGIKQDTLTALRTAPLHLPTLFPDATIKRAEEDIAQFESKGHSTSGHSKGRYHPYERPDKKSGNKDSRSDKPAWKTIGKVVLPHFHPDLPRASSHINDSYCITKLQTRLLARSNFFTQTKDTLNVQLPVVPLVTTAPGQSQKKDLSPGPVNCQYKECKLKSVKSASCVTQLSCVNPVTNVPNVAFNLPVRARLQSFWKTWLDLGAGPKVVQILKEGYTLPFRIRPKLVRFPTVISCYVNPQRNSYLLEALHQLIDKNAVEIVRNQTSLSFFNRLFLVPKPNNRWRPILDLSNLNFFLKAEKFKMETPETIRTSLQQGEWITSTDFKDAYFHIPIQEQSRKSQEISCSRTNIPIQSPTIWTFDSTTGVHCSSEGGQTDGYTQGYKDPPVPRRLVGESRIPSSLSPTHSRAGTDMPKVRLASKLGKIGTGAQTNLQFCRLPVRPKGRSGPAYTGPVADPPRENLRNPVSLPACPVRQFMSLIGLTATEKQVYLGRLHMRPIQ